MMSKEVGGEMGWSVGGRCVSERMKRCNIESAAVWALCKLNWLPGKRELEERCLMLRGARGESGNWQAGAV